jgi:hypothetical protein
MGKKVIIKDADFSAVAIGHSTIVPKPTIQFNSANNSVTITATEGDTIRYTTDGSTPTKTTGYVYSSAIQLTTSGTHTIRAIAINNNVASSVETQTYSISAVTPPTISISNNSCTIAANGADSIRYTIDGSDPTQSHGSVYTGLAIQLTQSGTVKAIAIKSGVASAIASKEHTVTHQEIVVVPAKNMQSKKKLDVNGNLVDASSVSMYVYRFDLNDLTQTPIKYYVTARTTVNAGEPGVSFRDTDNNVLGVALVGTGTATTYDKEEIQIPAGTRYIYAMANRQEVYPELRVKIDVDGVSEYETSDPITPTETISQSFINSLGEVTASSSDNAVVYKYDISNISNLKDVIATCRVGTTVGALGLVFRNGSIVTGSAFVGTGTPKIWIDNTVEVPAGTTEVYVGSYISYIYPYLKTKTLKTT